MDRKTNYLLLIFGGGLLLYLVFFPVALGKELVLLPAWNASLGDGTDSGGAGKKTVTLASDKPDAFGFIMGGRIAYLSRGGSLSYQEPIMYSAAVSDEYFINYSSVPDTLYLKNSAGRIVSSLSERGYPFIRSGRLFTFDSDREGIGEWDFSGEPVWRKRFASIITDVSVNSTSVLVGLLDGDAFLLDEKGSEAAVLSPGGSRLPVIYAVSVSSDDNLIAIISGMDPQRFLLYQRKKDSFKPVYHTELNSDFRRRMLVSFSSDENYVLHEESGDVAIFDTRTQTISRIPVSGKTERIIPVDADRVVILTSESGMDGKKEYTLTELLYPDHIYMRIKLTAISAFVLPDGDSLFFGADGSVFRVDTVEG